MFTLQLTDIINRMARRNKPEKLSRLRDGWEEAEIEEARLLRNMTIEESIGHLLSLQDAFEPELQRTEGLFRSERLATLKDLQKRLIKLEDWNKRRRRVSPD